MNVSPEPPPPWKEKVSKIQAKYRGKTVALAYSGGVDSGTLLAVLKTVAARLIAFTISAQNMPQEEIRRAEDVASFFKIEFHIVPMDILKVPHFAENPPNRCYLCKKEVFSTLQNRVQALGGEILVDGTNADDVTGDYRPGLQALRELKVESPWADFGVTKDEIRQVARNLGLKFAETPSAACLASRVPYGEPISEEILKKVEIAEEFLRATFALAQVRVRVHGGSLVRIEVPLSAIPTLSTLKASSIIVQKFQELGFIYITLDLAGFRSGSLNPPRPRQEPS
jgi:uncharacterized protein